MPDSPVAPALPVTHHDHPLWNGFSWELVLKILETAATVAPAVVAITSPTAAPVAMQLSGLTKVVAVSLEQELGGQSPVGAQ
jgi:hypothetical protein